MRLLFALALGCLAACQAQLIYPDEWLNLQRQAEEWQRQLQHTVRQASPKNDRPPQPTPATAVPSAQAPPVKIPEKNITVDAVKVPDKPGGCFVKDTTASGNETFADFLPPKWKNHVVNLISRGVTRFALDIDRAIVGGRNLSNSENVVFSPLSLTGTLAMVLLASSGKTFQEVSKILGLESGVEISKHSEIVHQILGLVLLDSENVTHPIGYPEYKYAFGLFVENDLPIREQFRKISRMVYKSDVISVDFKGRGQDAKKTINNWVSNKTMNKIAAVLSEPPNQSTEVLIASALYFQGEWLQHFSEESTTRARFTIEPNVKFVDIDMMYTAGEFRFYENPKLGLKMVGLPYKGEQVTMYILLPALPGSANLEKFKSTLNPDLIEQIVQNSTVKPSIVGMPKMQISSTLRLQNALESLGLLSLFNPSTADLSILSPGRTPTNQTATPPNDNKDRPVADQPIEKDQTEEIPEVETVKLDIDEKRNATKVKRSYGESMRIKMLIGDEVKDEEFKDLKNAEQEEEKPHDETSSEDKIQNKRHTRPIDEEFVEFLRSAKLPAFGIDELRNTPDIKNPGIYANDVLHKVEMTVNERGTEAAAVTITTIDRGNDYKRLVANRPFLFFIRHEPVKLIWFWGTVHNPEVSQ